MTPIFFSATDEPAAEARLGRVRDVCQRLLAGQSLNRLNRSVLSVIATTSAQHSHPDVDSTDIDSWLLFAIATQSYCSPTRARENTVNEIGIFRFSEQVRYLRSELNTQAFGERYSRDSVAIRTECANSFAELAARYITMSPAKKMRVVRDLMHIRNVIASATVADGYMAIIDVVADDLPHVERQFEGMIHDHARGAYYIRVSGTATPDYFASVATALRETKSELQILLEEDYNPFGIRSSGMRKVTFLHNQQDARRYQLLQDAASMGYRITLADVIRNHHEADRLKAVLDTTLVADEDAALASARYSQSLSAQVMEQHDNDRAVLRDVLGSGYREVVDVRARTPLDAEIIREVKSEAEALQAALSRRSDNAGRGGQRASFRNAYYRLRVFLQYAARLADRNSDVPRSVVESRIASAEDCTLVAATSGMAAIRTVLCTLGDVIDRVYSSEHYWETDFLVENAFSHNPHYPRLAATNPDKLTLIPVTASPAEIASCVDAMVTANKTCPKGQLVCLDKSISPFFYTRSFDLVQFTGSLASRADAITNPIYLVVDNTLDLQLGVCELFPEGIPRNIILIFTSSNAKLHQLGFDCVTGGLIELHCHLEYRARASELAEAFTAALEKEGNLQNSYALRLLLYTYYGRDNHGRFPAYRRFMIDARQRNTAAIIHDVTRNLADYGISMPNGVWQAASEILLDSPDHPNKTHRLALTIHHDPQSRLHAYVGLKEPPNDDYLSGQVFEELKRRVFRLANAVGLPLADGTSWGFITTRLDWYMHTLRIAVGTEDERATSYLGAILSSVLKELICYPHDFLRKVEVVSLSAAVRDAGGASRIGEIIALDSLIPRSKQADPNFYHDLPETAEEYSFVATDEDHVLGLVVAHAGAGCHANDVCISRAATQPEARARGLFRRMLEHVKDRAAANGREQLYLQTSASPHNIEVIRAYERCGFVTRVLKGCVMPNGWPLIKAHMELDLRHPAPFHVFSPVKEEIYRAVFEGARLEDIAATLPYPLEIADDT